MATVNVRIDYRDIEKQVHESIKKQSRLVADKQADLLYRRAHRNLLRDFDKHPITAEILAGNTAVNFSDTLEGYGNLFSFIGFRAGTDPINPLRQVLEEGVSMRPMGYRAFAWHYKITLPSRGKLEAATPMPWEGGNSWAYAMEQGMSNLSYYMYKRTNSSRSKTGIQAGDEGWEINEDISFQKTKYLSELFQSFRETVDNNI